MANKYALCIGINNYPGTQDDLSGCVNDANDWAVALKKRGFTVSKLLDSAAKGKAIKQAITSLLDAAESGDTVVIQFSGHGSFVPDRNGDEPDGTDECLCPYDVSSKGVITDDVLSDLFSRRARGVKLIFFSDSCHSGTVAKFARISTPPTVKGKRPPQRVVRFLPPANFLSTREANQLGVRSRRPASPPGRHQALLISGCQDTETSSDAWFNGRPNGAFTYVALRALARLPKTASYRDWYNAIRKALPSRQYPQSPNLYGTSSMKSWKVLG